jgi:GNAT superfamily N-acetyltransferase
MGNRQLGRELLIAIKSVAGSPGPQLVIPVATPPIAFLRPVATRKEFLNPNDIHVLTIWRNRFVKAFLTEFQATEARTAKWLVEVVGPSDKKILFMVDDIYGRTFGYMGLDYIDWERGYGEADAVVRGGDATRGTMKVTLQVLLKWARGHLGLCEIGVRVKLSNMIALEFYKKVGFQEFKRVPLRKVVESDMIRWVEDPSIEKADDYLVYMLWKHKDGQFT